MDKTLQSVVVKKVLRAYLVEGVSDKQELYSLVVKKLGVPRPTVRRVARDLRRDLLAEREKLAAREKGATVAAQAKPHSAPGSSIKSD